MTQDTAAVAPVAQAASPATATPPPAPPPAQPEAAKAPAPPQKWWQWMFLYPATAAALLTAVPSWIDKGQEVYHDLSGTGITIAEARHRQNLITKNMSCLGTVEAWVAAEGMKVDGTICDSGDILIRVVTHDGKKALDIFETASLLAGSPAVQTASASPTLGRLFSMAAEARSLPPEAVTAPTPAAPRITLAQEQMAITICQKYIDDRMLLRHVQVGGACFNETLDTFTGYVVSREQVPCQNSCG